MLNIISSRKPSLVGLIPQEDFSARGFLESSHRISNSGNKRKRVKLKKRRSLAVMKFEQKCHVTSWGVLKLILGGIHTTCQPGTRYRMPNK
jgi:hypothetical protein